MVCSNIEIVLYWFEGYRIKHVMWVGSMWWGNYTFPDFFFLDLYPKCGQTFLLLQMNLESRLSADYLLLALFVYFPFSIMTFPCFAIYSCTSRTSVPLSLAYFFKYADIQKYPPHSALHSMEIRWAFSHVHFLWIMCIFCCLFYYLEKNVCLRTTREKEGEGKKSEHSRHTV